MGVEGQVGVHPPQGLAERAADIGPRCRAGDEVKVADVGDLPEGEEDLGRRRLVGSQMAHATCDTHHLSGLSIPDPYVVIEGVAARPKALCQDVVDEDHRCAVLVVLRLQVPPHQDREAHGLHVAVRDETHIGQGRAALPLGVRHVVDVDAPPAVETDGKDIGEPGCDDARDLAGLVERVVVVRDLLLGRLEPGGGVDAEGDALSGIEAHLHVREAQEAPREETSPDQEDAGEGYLPPPRGRCGPGLRGGSRKSLDHLRPWPRTERPSRRGPPAGGRTRGPTRW